MQTLTINYDDDGKRANANANRVCGKPIGKPRGTQYLTMVVNNCSSYAQPAAVDYGSMNTEVELHAEALGLASHFSLLTLRLASSERDGTASAVRAKYKYPPDGLIGRVGHRVLTSSSCSQSCV
eukprot:scaffold22613_cov99-Skeletonema_dohrnii-CCMP3373.AAC.1